MACARIRACIHATILTLCAASPLVASSNSMLAVSADGRLLATANRDNGTVSVIDLVESKVLREIPAGHKPESVLFLGDTSIVAVTVYTDDVVKLLDAHTGEVTGTIDVPDEPYGLAATSDGKRLYVTCEYPGVVVECDVAAKTISRTIPAGPMLRGIAISERQNRLYVTEYLTSSVVAVDSPPRLPVGDSDATARPPAELPAAALLVAALSLFSVGSATMNLKLPAGRAPGSASASVGLSGRSASLFGSSAGDSSATSSAWFSSPNFTTRA